MKTISTALRLLIGIALLVPGLSAAQQPYPSRPIRIIVPFPPGASNDILARVVGKKLTESLGVQAIVDNRPGGSTIIGATVLQKSAPDGYTMMVTSGTHILTTLLIPAPYDPVKDFLPVATLDRSDYLFVVTPALPVNSLKEFVALAKAKPGQINYASSSKGSPNHLAAEMFALRTGIKMQHVPYKGGGPAVIDLMAGQVQMFFNSPSSLVPYVKSGKLKALAVTGEKRMEALPDVPTFTEAGIPNFDIKSWHGILMPLGTPKAVVDRINAEVAKLLVAPDVVQTLASFGLAPFVSSPDQFGAMMRQEAVRYAGVIKAANITAD